MPAKSAQSNRRSNQRRAPRSNVTIEVRRGTTGLGKNLALYFVDVSDSGVKVVLREEFKPGDEAEVILHGFGMRKPLKTASTVCWAMKLDDGSCCVGLRFDKPLPYRDVSALFKP